MECADGHSSGGNFAQNYLTILKDGAFYKRMMCYVCKSTQNQPFPVDFPAEKYQVQRLPVLCDIDIPPIGIKVSKS